MQDRQVLVTGGTGALGTAVTKLLLARGARVTVSYVIEGQAGALRDELQGGHLERLTLRPADLFDEHAVAELVGAMPEIDALVHLVGGFSMRPTHEETLEGFRAQQDINLTTAFLCCKHALVRMRARGHGRIVTVASRAALEAQAETAAYSAAKAGVLALTRVIAAETKGHDITANCVLPSVIDTPANRAAMGENAAARWVRPESIAETVAYLASAAARDVRGAALTVYGDA
jgi:NAD(P)-dependent dehydrogenase (short-subunit alcohol dehydrogenase family)